MKKFHGAHTTFLPLLINVPIGKIKLMQTIFPKSTNYYVEKKCQLDATEVFTADLTACI